MLTYIEKKFLYYTECQLATLEGLRGIKRTPKCELKRQESIANGMVEVSRSILGDPPFAHEVKSLGLLRLLNTEHRN